LYIPILNLYQQLQESLQALQEKDQLTTQELHHTQEKLYKFEKNIAMMQQERILMKKAIEELKDQLKEEVRQKKEVQNELSETLDDRKRIKDELGAFKSKFEDCYALISSRLGTPGARENVTEVDASCQECLENSTQRWLLGDRRVHLGKRICREGTADILKSFKPSLPWSGTIAL
jgi:predicted RNase H-like nuclease (RuvC/YqgF family)